jgi:hypothetical protein
MRADQDEGTKPVRSTLRRVEAVDRLPGDAAVTFTRDPATGCEIWQLNRNAGAADIADGCNAALEVIGVHCSGIRAHGSRRARWLLLAALAGLILPSPFHSLYHRAEALAYVSQIAAVAIMAALLTLALREHVVMRRLSRAITDPALVEDYRLLSPDERREVLAAVCAAKGQRA